MIDVIEVLRAMVVNDPNWICEGVPDDVIEAGIAAFDQTQTDLQNYVSGQTPDWDEGMICAAIFKAMLRQVLGE